MQGVLLVLVLVACNRATTEKPPPPPSPPGAAPVVRDAAIIVDALPVDALPAELVAAPPMITRRITTGQIVQHHTAETYSLQIAGSQALLSIRSERGVPKQGDLLGIELERWEHLETKWEVGTATISGKATKLAFHGGRALECTSAMQTVAPEGATRRPPARPAHEDCGDEGRWDPAATKRISVLRCKGTDDELTFAAAPGIEWVFVNDDCVMQGGGWRLIAKDGSIAGIRHPKDHER